MAVGRWCLALALLVTPLLIPRAALAQATVGPAYVTRVVDGDTLYLELGGRLETVRYLGVNTPRIEHPTYGAEPYALLAREANRRLVEGQWVRLVFDGPVRDRYDRLLAYVWVGGTFVNALLVHRGYSEAASASTSGYASYFAMLEEGARRDARGLWRDPGAAIYHRRKPTEVTADSDDLEGRADSSGGRVFSAPAPFIPSSASSFAPSIAVPGGPTTPPPSRTPTPSPSTTTPSSSSSRGGMRTTR
jgi:endonuclease YncB( thermonuclease family)